MSLKLVDYESLNGDVKKYQYAIRANLVDPLLGLWISKHILSGEILVNAGSVLIPVRAMMIINPRNPSGQCLSEANLREILRFCCDERLVLFRDEVYQQNIYKDERPSSAPRK
uniref:Aminotransferase class I/classII large domain-containing protein n=2 Tax=Brassica oleracea TaxID=3712 RepID=A0A0D3AAP4_BRAOL|nr:unnamed protein product [Brassica oleracea]